MRDRAVYLTIIEAIVAEKRKLLGDAALRRAAETSGLALTPKGQVARLEGDGYEALVALLQLFERLTGTISNVSARRVVRELGVLERLPALELPEQLR